MPDFFPRRDGDLAGWAQNFAARLAASPGDYGVSAQAAADFVAVQQAYAQWYTKSQQPSMRTAVSVRMKNQTRAAMKAKGRELAGVIRARRETTSEQMVVLGLRPRSKRRKVVGPPVVSPRVQVKSVKGARATVRLEDRVTGKSRKPRGVAMAVVLYVLGDVPPVDVADWKFGLTTGDPTFDWSLPMGSEAGGPRPGDPVWLVACWVNERGEQGPWSDPTAWRVNYGFMMGKPGAGVRRAA